MIKNLKFYVDNDKRLELDMNRFLSKIDADDVEINQKNNKVYYYITNISENDFIILLHNMCEFDIYPTIYTFIN